MPAINELLKQGRYRIIQPLGQNGIGVVYEAYDNVLETNVVFKEISSNLKNAANAGQETLERDFAGEAKILTEMRHESLLNVHDYFSELDHHYLVMESVDGNNLSELLEKGKNSPSLSDVANWADQLLDALHYLHTQMPPIIHRDIKPQNVKLTAGGKIKLLALGIAGKSDARVNATITNQALQYMPLEQIWVGLDSASQKVIANSYDEKSERILEQPADARSDLYALGAIVYHLLTGRVPIDALERSIDILEGKPDPLLAPSRINSNIPSEISDVLMKALEIKRENRFSSAVIMRQALRTAFVRVKEREAEATNKQDEDLLEIPLAEYKDSEREARFSAPKTLDVEAENTRQIELMKERLREAEAKRLEAERRAAEAEKRLFEKDTRDLSDNESIATAAKASENFVEASAQTNAASAQNATTESSPDEFKDLFAAPPKDNKVLLRMSAAAGVLVVLCGAFWGVWVLLKSNPAESNQITPSQTMSLTDTAKPEPTASIAPNVETTPETSALTTPETAPDSTETTANSPVIKNKPLAPALPRAKKQTLPATKPATAGKKPVTVDDLINDN